MTGRRAIVITKAGKVKMVTEKKSRTNLTIAQTMEIQAAITGNPVITTGREEITTDRNRITTVRIQVITIDRGIIIIIIPEETIMIVVITIITPDRNVLRTTTITPVRTIISNGMMATGNPIRAKILL